MRIHCKNGYRTPKPSDGHRVLVDRIWLRSVKKTQARLDRWMKDIAPSTELRKWFGHDPDKWEEFKRRYFKELDGRSHQVDELLALAKDGTVTLVFGSRNHEHNNAVALKQYLEHHADVA
jgi:uncharacterized protein YeaO (DUF488 family)